MMDRIDVVHVPSGGHSGGELGHASQDGKK